MGTLSVQHGVRADCRAREACLAHEVGFVFEPTTTLALATFNERVGRPLQDLLTLSAGRTNAFMNLSAKADPEGTEWLEIYFQPLGATAPHRPMHASQMLLALSDVKGREEDFFDRWLTLPQRGLESVRTLLTGIQYRSEAFLDQRFLYVVHATETFHREVVGGTEVSEDDHAERLNAVLRSSPSEYRQWLEQKLQHSNELSLRRRLRVLLDRACVRTQDMLGTERKKFVDLTVNTRNFYTHHDATRSSAIVQGGELLWLTQALIGSSPDLCVSRLPSVRGQAAFFS